VQRRYYYGQLMIQEAFGDSPGTIAVSPQDVHNAF
jgi:hypothetical protein